MNPKVREAMQNVSLAFEARERAIVAFRTECSKFIARAVPIEVVNAREKADEDVRAAVAAFNAVVAEELR